MKNFSGGVAVITGAASGLGKAFAEHAAGLGMKLVLGDVQTEALEATLSELRGRGAQAVGRRADVSRSADVQALADAAMNEFGKVNLLFNNAGVTAGGLVWENTELDWDWVLGVNLMGVIHGVRIFTPLMLAAARADEHYEGHIVNTASMAGMAVSPAGGIYSVSKHAVVALSEALHQDLHLVTTRVNASVLCPSYVSTGIGDAGKTRPEALRNAAPLTNSQRLALQISRNSLTTATTSAADVCALTYEAIHDERFYVFPNPAALSLVQQRAENILQQRNPADVPDAHPARLARREQLRQALAQ